MIKCPHCERSEQQVKVGKTRGGSQRYLCKVCGRKYTPHGKTVGYSAVIHEAAVKDYIDGDNYRRTGRHFGVSHRSVMNWVKARAEQVAEVPPQPEQPTLDVNEMDELFTFVGHKKTSFTS